MQFTRRSRYNTPKTRTRNDNRTCLENDLGGPASWRTRSRTKRLQGSPRGRPRLRFSNNTVQVHDVRAAGAGSDEKAPLDVIAGVVVVVVKSRTIIITIIITTTTTNNNNNKSTRGGGDRVRSTVSSADTRLSFPLPCWLAAGYHIYRKKYTRRSGVSSFQTPTWRL